MKLIFLDIDGVLNCAGTASRAPSGCIGIDDDKIKRLKEIVDATGAKVVLTSTWKTEWFKTEFKEDLPKDGAYLEKKLKSNGIFLFDKTDEPTWDKRGVGILSFVGKYKENVESFVILDDESFDFVELGIDNRHVKTMFLPRTAGELCGLQGIHVENAIKILNTEFITQ
jgi:hypothetical protein